MIPVKKYNNKIEKISHKIESLDKSFLSKNPFIYESVIEPQILALVEKREKLQQITADAIKFERARLGKKGFYLTDDGTIISLSVKMLFEMKKIEPLEETCDAFGLKGLVKKNFDPQEKVYFYVPTFLGGVYIMNEKRNSSPKDDFNEKRNSSPKDDFKV